MSWFSLIAELGVNINPFSRGLDEAQRVAGRAGQKIGKDLKNKLWGAFGTGAVLAGVKQVIGDSADIERLAFRTQRSTKEIQAMQYAAERTGLSFGEIESIMDGTSTDTLPHMRTEVSRLIEEFDKLGIGIDDHLIKKMSDIDRKWTDLVSKMKQKAVETVDVASKMSWPLALGPLGPFAFWVAQKGGFAAALGLEEPKTPPPPREPEVAGFNRLHDATPPKMEKVRDVGLLQTDNFAKIGGFVGNAATANPMVDIARQQLRVQKQIEANTKTGNFGADKYAGGG